MATGKTNANMGSGAEVVSMLSYEIVDDTAVTHSFSEKASLCFVGYQHGIMQLTPGETKEGFGIYASMGADGLSLTLIPTGIDVQAGYVALK